MNGYPRLKRGILMGGQTTFQTTSHFLLPEDQQDGLPIRVCHLQFFLISLLFQAGIYLRHTKEQEK